MQVDVHFVGVAIGNGFHRCLLGWGSFHTALDDNPTEKFGRVIVLSRKNGNRRWMSDFLFGRLFFRTALRGQGHY
jgi:hypothetical protein